MSHYFIRRLTPSRVELGKFDADRNGPPVDVYTIHGGRCDCPSPKHPCKHNFVVTRWELIPEPERFGMYYDDTDDGFHRHPLSVWMLPQSIAKYLKMSAEDLVRLLGKEGMP